MKNASGSPTDKKNKPLINQRSWRATGVACIGGCAFLAWHGQDAFLRDNAPLFLMGYWGLFFVLLLIAVYVVLLDIRYIRMQFKLGERELFQDTVHNDQIRKALLEAKATQNNTASSPPPDQE